MYCVEAGPETGMNFRACNYFMAIYDRFMNAENLDAILQEEKEVKYSR